MPIGFRPEVNMDPHSTALWASLSISLGHVVICDTLYDQQRAPERQAVALPLGEGTFVTVHVPI